MNTFLDYLFVIALFGLILLPALVGQARERIVDRQLREAELGRADVRRARLLQAELREARRRSAASEPVGPPVSEPVSPLASAPARSRVRTAVPSRTLVRHGRADAPLQPPGRISRPPVTGETCEAQN
ncbi:hypothetical protein [Streptomyces sp. SLBN-118]|uniref:hypothetical protein n=1 Tax=Streptomyces sp. SLBN-118 TaxID=2768454 RepID=UPI00114DF9BC|nr:hypothetical protein [Streptomyces sp. SLBN-118]